MKKGERVRVFLSIWGVIKCQHDPSTYSPHIQNLGDLSFPTVELVINEKSKEDLDKVIGPDEKSALVGLLAH